MTQDPTALELHRAQYERFLRITALRVRCGEDPRPFIEHASFVADHELAAVVPHISKTAPRLSKADLRLLPWRASLAPFPRRVVDVAIARHCVRQDLLSCVAVHFGPQLAAKWARRMALDEAA